MTIIVRYLMFSSNLVTVEESFLGFLDVNDTTGKGLFDITVEELKSLSLELDDMRGQGYDNGANMKGKRQGMQTRFLNENPRAFYTPCGCHSLNLTLYGMATISTKGKSFFGKIQLLDKVNIVRKRLQSKDMHLEIAIKEIKRLINFFKKFRENGFSKAIDEAEKVTFEMGIDSIFAQKHTRFDKFKNYEKLFGFLFPQNLRGIEDEDLKLSCNFLENTLKFEGRSDIDGKELYMELSALDTLYTMEFSSPIEVMKHLNETQENFPNARIAYRILLTIPVIVASIERSFSKLKLLKSYLRSTMSQERLNTLAMIAIESEILDSINCEEVIKQFDVKNARRASRIIG
ncbi:uncharacterized protein LOC143537588 [Bidens hawaiensis]|uniref:uncharacterized protein LOC143537588 n=1 Tax=Bidens hawaiensis TaxID=980011 RepID=UPI00404B9235